MARVNSSDGIPFFSKSIEFSFNQWGCSHDPIVQRHDPMTEVIMRVQGLKKNYGSLTAVKSLDLDVFRGEILGFLGPNGAGKTTSINMMCGLLRPDAGSVIIQGESITDKKAGFRSRIGLCPQNVAIWERLTCAEQLRLVATMHGMSAAEAHAASARLLEDFGFSDNRNKQARKLSGGMQRRLNLAMSLVHDPDIVFLDEPEAGLDPQSRVMIRDYVRNLSGRKTIILTTHNMDEADRLSDRVAIIDHGDLLALDTPEALKQRMGDEEVLEIELEVLPKEPAILETSLSEIDCKVELDPSGVSLFIRGSRVISKLAAISEKLTEAGVVIGEIRMRQTTLEDVFIHLTGRRLRG
jgi:ABC-2 type transport system ATP-binding protein